MKISEQLCEKIEEQIAMGELPHGSALDEAMLVARYGVSRTPIREALRLLSAEGLIDIRPRRGAVVKSASPTRLVEMFEVMDEPEREALVQAHAACEEAHTAGDSDAYFYGNENFHRAIYCGSHNGFLQEEAMSLHRRLQLRVRGRLDTSFSEHATVVHGEHFADLVASLEALK